MCSSFSPATPTGQEAAFMTYIIVLIRLFYSPGIGTEDDFQNAKNNQCHEWLRYRNPIIYIGATERL